MEQETRFRYSVRRNERITIIVTPVQVGPRVTAAQNGEVLDNSGPATRPRFRFTATQVERNSHFLVLDCDFVPADPSTAYFQIDISGSAGGDFPDVVRVKKIHKVHQPEFRFTVRS